MSDLFRTHTPRPQHRQSVNSLGVSLLLDTPPSPQSSEYNLSCDEIEHLEQWTRRVTLESPAPPPLLHAHSFASLSSGMSSPTCVTPHETSTSSGIMSPAITVQPTVFVKSDLVMSPIDGSLSPNACPLKPKIKPIHLPRVSQDGSSSSPPSSLQHSAFAPRDLKARLSALQTNSKLASPPRHHFHASLVRCPDAPVPPSLIHRRTKSEGRIATVSSLLQDPSYGGNLSTLVKAPAEPCLPRDV